jgi:hypothetical protein
MMVAGTDHIAKENFLYLYPPAREAVFPPKNTCNGFAGAGPKPLNQGRVLEKVTFQLRTSTSLLSAEYSILSASQTPQNHRQLGHKVRSLQKSLQRKRTLSSSPMSHIHHLENAAQMAMHMSHLLQQEIKALRTENERKIEKKARKRATLGRYLFISVQEGRDRIQQFGTHVEEQVEDPTSGARQRATPQCCG